MKLLKLAGSINPDGTVSVTATVAGENNKEIALLGGCAALALAIPDPVAAVTEMEAIAAQLQVPFPHFP